MTKQTMLERWCSIKPIVYQEISDTIKQTAIYEPNTPYTWDRVRDAIDKVLTKFLGMGYIFDYQVICDGTVNTQETIANNKFILQFLWRVDMEDDYTIVEFILSSAGMEVKQ